MKRLLVAVAGFMVLAMPVMAQSLNDQVVLSSNNLFLQRVRQSIIFESVNISGDGLTGGINTKRHSQVANILQAPDAWKSQFASAIATTPAVINAATLTGTVALTPMVCIVNSQNCTGNADAQQALVSDAVINNGVLFVFNAFFGGQ